MKSDDQRAALTHRQQTITATAEITTQGFIAAAAGRLNRRDRPVEMKGDEEANREGDEEVMQEVERKQEVERR